MCDSPELLSVLGEIKEYLAGHGSARPSVDWSVMVSDTQGFIIDYHRRHHIYAYAPTSVTLSLGELGTLAITNNTWVDISVKPNVRIFTSGQATPVLLFLRATDLLNAGYAE